MSPYIQKITRDTLGFKATNDLPEAHWSRGAVTTAMTGFVHWFWLKNRERVEGIEEFELIDAWLLLFQYSGSV